MAEVVLVRSPFSVHVSHIDTGDAIAECCFRETQKMRIVAELSTPCSDHIQIFRTVILVAISVALSSFCLLCIRVKSAFESLRPDTDARRVHLHCLGRMTASERTSAVLYLLLSIHNLKEAVRFVTLHYVQRINNLRYLSTTLRVQSAGLSSTSSAR